MQVIWPLQLEPNLGRYPLLAGQKLDVSEAYSLQFGGEVLLPELPRPYAGH